MSRWSDFVLSHFTIRNIRKSDAIAKRCDRRCKRILGRLDKRKKELYSLQKRVASVSKVLLLDLDESEKTVKSLRESLESVQSELTIADEITIPGLVQSNKLLLERASADTAEQVRRQVASTSPRAEM